MKAAAERRALRPRWPSVFALLLLACQGLGNAQTVSEYQAKALYLYNFAKFVEWPADAFSGNTAPLQMCVFKENSFGSDLEQIVEGKFIAGHPVRIVIVRAFEQVRGCHILFIGDGQSRQSNQIFGSLGPTAVLTVGETKGFVQQGGMINFVVEGERVQFEVNQKAVEQARLSISSRLLSLAKLVIK